MWKDFTPVHICLIRLEEVADIERITRTGPEKRFAIVKSLRQQCTTQATLTKRNL